MKYGLIGEKLGHSLSPEIYRSVGLDYELMELKREELADFMRSGALTAFNVTIPYKQSVMKFLDFIDEEAGKINAVNTVVRKGGKRYGYNTDIFGMRLALSKSGIELKGKNVMILGTGGTSNTAYYMAKTANAASVVKVSRTGEVNYNNCYSLTDTDVIINTTPIGMYPFINAAPIDIAGFKKLSGVFDAVYNPLNTDLVTAARDTGIKASGGLYMLVGQAVKSISIFNDTDIDYDLINKIYNNLTKKFSNIVLIGMPSCGKSAIGKKTAEILNRDFIDTDELFEKTYGKTPEQIIVSMGENVFRQMETEVIKNIVKGNSVISTGGGIVTKKENISLLKRNGVIIYIERALNLLETIGRPLSAKSGVKTLFDTRRPLYEGCCDIKIKNDKTIDIAVKEVIEGYEKNFGD